MGESLWSTDIFSITSSFTFTLGPKGPPVFNWQREVGEGEEVRKRYETVDGFVLDGASGG